jgi:RimJ/RimL family protein N-acetyltransferase
MRYIGPWRAPDADWFRDRIRGVYVPLQAHPWHGLRIVLDRTNDEFLGWVFVRPATLAKDACELGWTQPGEEEVGYRYRQSAWGRGIATEAATPLVQLAIADSATTAVVACAHVDNTRSIRVLEKLGLERVGEVVLPDSCDPLAKLARMK